MTERENSIAQVARDILYCLDGMRECAREANYGEAGDWAWKTRHHTNKLLDFLQDQKLDELYRTDED